MKVKIHIKGVEVEVYAMYGKRYIFRMLTKSFMCRRSMNGKDEPMMMVF